MKAAKLEIGIRSQESGARRKESEGRRKKCFCKYEMLPNHLPQIFNNFPLDILL
ncbi:MULTISPECIES: hypothetical protein [unclassified Microcoleus]|uniref:hypothetical protein n=1 Tax=unclassified Microcoleus TaxID=2642155 RepID=UPI002FD34B71